MPSLSGIITNTQNMGGTFGINIRKLSHSKSLSSLHTLIRWLKLETAESNSKCHTHVVAVYASTLRRF